MLPAANQTVGAPKPMKIKMGQIMFTQSFIDQNQLPKHHVKVQDQEIEKSSTMNIGVPNQNLDYQGGHPFNKRKSDDYSHLDEQDHDLNRRASSIDQDEYTVNPRIRTDVAPNQ